MKRYLVKRYLEIRLLGEKWSKIQEKSITGRLKNFQL